MRLLYKQIARQDPIDVAAYQYLSDWWNPSIPYLNPSLVRYLVWCINNGVDEKEFKQYVKKTYDI
ncbi:hypothetical protein D3C84_1022160 [compost metagenome]